MKSQTIITLALLLLTKATITTQSNANDKVLPLIGIIAQPASSHLDTQYYQSEQHWTYIPRSYADWVSQSGGMPLLIPFDLPKERLDHLLDNIQGVLFPGGGSPLFDSKGNPTPFQNRVKYILDFAAKKNDKGTYYPIIGTCFGFQAMVSAMAGNDPNLLTCEFGDEETHHTITPGYDYSKNKFWSSMDQTLLNEAWSTGNIYYSHNCGFRPSVLTNSKTFKDNVYLLATSVSKTGKTFVANVEHKRYPFIANQWHAEKTQFERLDLGWLPRDKITRQFVSDYIMKVVDNTRPFSKEIEQIPGSVRAFFQMYHHPQRPGWNYFEQVYVFQRIDEKLLAEEKEMLEMNGPMPFESAVENMRKRKLREKYQKMLLEIEETDILIK